MERPPLQRCDDVGLAALRGGGDVLAAAAFARFSSRLAGLVRRRLGWKLRRKLDAEDIVQSVFRSFVRLQRDRDLSFETWESLWGLLALIAIRKCGHKIEHFMAARRRVSVEQSIGPGRAFGDDEARYWTEALSREPDPAQAAIVAETLVHVLQRLDDRDRRIVSLALEGATSSEISDEVQRSERTVQRVLKRVWEQLARQTS